LSVISQHRLSKEPLILFLHALSVFVLYLLLSMSLSLCQFDAVSLAPCLHTGAANTPRGKNSRQSIALSLMTLRSFIDNQERERSFIDNQEERES